MQASDSIVCLGDKEKEISEDNLFENMRVSGKEHVSSDIHTIPRVI